MAIAVGYQPADTLSVGWQDLQDPGSDDFNATLVVGTLTAAGQSILLARPLPVEAGSLTVVGSDFGKVIDNTTKNLVTVSDLSKIGVEITLFDALADVVPAINDCWWVSTTSTDSGTFTLQGDGSFTLGTPTAGPDQLDFVAYYDDSEGVWHGPAPVTFEDAPILLVVSPTTQPAFAGSELIYLTATRNVEVSTGVTIAGQAIEIQDQTPVTLTVTPGATVVAGREITLELLIQVTPSNDLQFAGRNIILFSGIKLEVDTIGALTVTSQTVRRDVSFAPLGIAGATIAGQDITWRLTDIYPSTIPVRTEIIPLTDGVTTREAADGTLRSVDLNTENSYRLRLVHPKVTSADVTTIMNFYDARRNVTFEYSPVIDAYTYQCQFTREPRWTTDNGNWYDIFVDLIGTRA